MALNFPFSPISYLFTIRIFAPLVTVRLSGVNIVHLMTVHRSEYAIKFTGLPNGVHEFGFAITGKFFQNREDTIIHGADIQAHVSLTKGTTMQLGIRMQGYVLVDCVRCLEPVQTPIDMEKTMLVRQVENPNPDDDDDDAINIALHAHEIDLEKIFYDYLTLQVPYSPVHEDKESGEPGCDPEILQFLQKKADNEEDDDDDENGGTWDALKNIKLN